MTKVKSSIGDACAQAETGPPAGRPHPELDPNSGITRALCYSTCKVLGLDLGVFVRQLHHLLTIPGGRNIIGYHWTYQTHDDLARMFPWWSKWQIRDRVLKDARKQGVLVTRRQQHGGQLYRLDYHLLNRLFDEVGEPLPDWLLDAQFDPPTLDGRQGGLVDVQEGPESTDSETAIIEPEHVKDSDSTTYESEHVKDSEITTFHHREIATSDVVKPLHPIYTEKTTEKTTESKLASSDNSDVSELDNPWGRTVGVADEPTTFLERVWTLYCDNYDDNETIGLDDSRWRPLRDGVIEWQRAHRALIDPSRAEQVFDSITTRNPREPIGLIYSVFRDELAVRDDLDTPYVPPVKRGQTRMAGRY